MIYQFIENLSRLIMEWAIKRQDMHQRNIVDEVQEGFSYQALRTERIRKVLE